MTNIHLSPSEYRALSWLADRYGSADVLYAATDDLSPDPGMPVYVLTLTPETLRDYWRELLADNGDPAQTVPPCAGGTLADKLRRIPERPAHLLDKWEGSELSICSDCLMLIANGETSPELDEGATARYLAAVEDDAPGWSTCTGSRDCEWCGAEMRAAAEALGFDYWDECEGWFAWSACDMCGSGRWDNVDPFANGSLGGTRYHACTFPVGDPSPITHGARPGNPAGPVEPTADLMADLYRP